MLVDAAAFWWALPLAVLGLPAVLAVYFGIAVAIARRFWSTGAERILVLALAFALAEYLRARLMTGFPWNEIGMMAAPWPLFMQTAAVWGTHGLTLIGVGSFRCPCCCFAGRLGGRPLLLSACHFWRSTAPMGRIAWRRTRPRRGPTPHMYASSSRRSTRAANGTRPRQTPSCGC